jgi:hypothetical protein
MSTDNREVMGFGRELDRGGNPPVDRGGTLARKPEHPGQGQGHDKGHDGNGHGKGHGHGHDHGQRPPPQGRSHATL